MYDKINGKRVNKYYVSKEEALVMHNTTKNKALTNNPTQHVLELV